MGSFFLVGCLYLLAGYARYNCVHLTQTYYILTFYFITIMRSIVAILSFFLVFGTAQVFGQSAERAVAPKTVPVKAAIMKKAPTALEIRKAPTAAANKKSVSTAVADLKQLKATPVRKQAVAKGKQ